MKLDVTNCMNDKWPLTKRKRKVLSIEKEHYFSLQKNARINILETYIIRFWETATYPSPKSKLTLSSYLGQNVGLGEGYVGTFPETYNDPTRDHYKINTFTNC